jgi:NAD(P)-dependent dehydrogenase (short-subunit alcohol dehydrogenase family)
MRLSGRKAIVTGAGSGIGLATVTRLRVDGAEVIGVDLSGADVSADVTTSEGLGAIIAAAGERLDILVNNAGVCPVAPLEQTDDAIWAKAFDVNVTGAFRLVRALAPLLTASTAGRVINIGSILSSYGDAGLLAYSASKHAVLGLTRALANELGSKGVTANCVQPGCIVTGMTKDMLEAGTGADVYYQGKSPLGRLGQPEDIADVIAFLASDDSRFITGQGIVVDGGIMSHS